MTPPQRRRLRDHLGHLQRLPAQERLAALLHDARAQAVTSAAVLARLRTEELLATGEQAGARRTALARCPCRNTLASVDDGVQPAVARQTLQDLASGRVLDHGAQSVCRGPPGTGHTPVARGLGRKAGQPGHRTLFTAA